MCGVKPRIRTKIFHLYAELLMGSTAAPSIPPRPPNQSTSSSGTQQQAADPFASDSDAVPNDPPPAYEPQAGVNQEQTLQTGPSRPFQEAPAPSPPQQSTLSAPQYPWWNGAQLTPQQTGFNPASTPYSNGRYSAPSQSPPLASPSSSSYAPPSAPPPPNSSSSAPAKYEPTTQPTDGQPLLNGGRLLVYPKGFICHKCSNTGYKPFKNRPGDDPNHPCKQDWSKYSKPFSGALVISCRNPEANYQRPLRLPPLPQPPPQQQYRPPPPPVPPPMMMSPYGVQPQPVYHPPPAQMYGAPVNYGWGNNVPPGGALVVRPGDPRIGGRLCYRCGGDGLIEGFFSDDTCHVCFGSGRIM